MLEETIKCVRLIIGHNFSWDNHITHVSKRIFSGYGIKRHNNNIIHNNDF